MGRPVLVSACRTPVGKFLGALSPLPATALGAKVVAESLRRVDGLKGEDVDEVLMGHVLQAGTGQNPARQALRGAGIPDAVAAVTINKVCGSGLKTVMLAAQAIKAGDGKIFVAGGMESMSQAPYLLPTARNGARLGHAQALDAVIHDGLWDHYNDMHMGQTGELVADKYEISREEQDAWAAQSHARAVAAEAAGHFAAERVNVDVPGRKGAVTTVAQDEGPRADSTPEALAKLRAAFKKDGSVTAGNASSINDGAAAVVVMDEDVAKERGIQPLARVLGYATGGLAPEWVMMAPEVAVNKLLSQLGMKIDDFGLVELNEAFAVQMVALARVLGIDHDRLNVHGGAVAIGHPIGASGARCLTTLVHAMRTKNVERGMVGLCLGGGNAVVMAVERMS